MSDLILTETEKISTEVVELGDPRELVANLRERLQPEITRMTSEIAREIDKGIGKGKLRYIRFTPRAQEEAVVGFVMEDLKGRGFQIQVDQQSGTLFIGV